MRVIHKGGKGQKELPKNPLFTPEKGKNRYRKKEEKSISDGDPPSLSF